MDGISEVSENLFALHIPLPGNPLKELNAYVLRGSVRNLLVDTGFRQEPCRKALLAGLNYLGIRMDETDIFLTHLHADHTGLAPEIASADTKIFIGEYDLPRLPGCRSEFSWRDSDRRYSLEGFPPDLLMTLRTANPAQSLAPVPYNDYIPVKDGEVFRYAGYTMRAVHTPGHTPGHLILWDETRGLALLGDHVLFDITPNISRWVGRADSLGDYLTSLRSIRALPVKTPLPAHRAVRTGFSERCDELIAHHARRCDEVLNILSDGGEQNAWRIASRMTWKIRAACWEDFPTPQKWFAVGEALAHLDHLVTLGRVRRLEAENGTVTYAPEG